MEFSNVSSLLNLTHLSIKINLKKMSTNYCLIPIHNNNESQLTLYCRMFCCLLQIFSSCVHELFPIV